MPSQLSKATVLFLLSFFTSSPSLSSFLLCFVAVVFFFEFKNIKSYIISEKNLTNCCYCCAVLNNCRPIHLISQRTNKQHAHAADAAVTQIPVEIYFLHEWKIDLNIFDMLFSCSIFCCCCLMFFFVASFYKNGFLILHIFIYLFDCFR